MNPTELTATPTPDPRWQPAVRALWYAARDDWHQAHDALQDASGPHADWVHAHLHRIEGDPGNAAYWYRRARQPIPPQGLSFSDEWQQIASAVLRDA